MTPTTDDMDVPNQNDAGFRPGAVAAGVILLVAGAAMFLGRSGIDIRFGRLIGPLFLIAMGASMVLGRSAFVIGHRQCTVDGQRRRRPHWRGGVSSGIWLIGIGVWVAVAQTHIFGLDYHNSWPLLVIMAGVMMMIRGMR